MGEDQKDNHAIVSGFVSNSSGKAASLTAPSAPAQQAAITDAYRMARLHPLDVDAVECDGKGNLLHDAVEVSAIAKCLRSGSGGDEEMLSVCSSKSGLGYLQ